MKTARLIILGALLGITSQAALAFQETKGGTQDDATAKSAAPEAGLSTPLPEAHGQEIRVPGLGPIGVLPKLDFGLELLYGASGSQQGGPVDEKQDAGAQIRGTLKYRFPN